jgi:hypothetical protein
MLKTKPVRIDGQLTEVKVGATVADMVPFDVQSIATPSGALITREQFARVPVPDGFDTNLSAINKGGAQASRADTLPMLTDPETFLRLTVLALSKAMDSADQKFLGQAMRTYAQAMSAADVSPRSAAS